MRLFAERKGRKVPILVARSMNCHYSNHSYSHLLCFPSHKRRQTPKVYQMRRLPSIKESNNFSLTRNPSYGDAPLEGQEPLKASIPPVKESDEMYMEMQT